MAELSTEPPSTCCSADVQATCCEPTDKAECCGTSAAGASGGCAAGEPRDIRENVRARYASAAQSIAERPVLTEADEAGLFGAELYEGVETEGAPGEAQQVGDVGGLRPAQLDHGRSHAEISSSAPGTT